MWAVAEKKEGTWQKKLYLVGEECRGRGGEGWGRRNVWNWNEGREGPGGGGLHFVREAVILEGRDADAQPLCHHRQEAAGRAGAGMGRATDEEEKY